MAAQASSSRPERRVLVTVLVVLATLIGLLAIHAVWLNRQALNTDNWAESSSQLLQKEAIRDSISQFLTDQAYANFDVEAQVRQALPPRAAPLAGPAAGALRTGAERVINELLQRPRIQALWEQANRRAHRRLMQVLEGGGGAVSTTGGNVTLDLGEVLQQTSQSIGVGGRAANKLPPGAAEITIMRSNQLSAAQDITNLLRKLAIVLPVLSIGLFAVAIAVAGRRREALRAAGWGFLVIGIGALIIRSLAEKGVVDALVKTASTRPAVEDVWEVGTTQLVIAAQAMIGYGIAIILAAWLAGPTGAALAVRRWAAPYLRDARYAYGATTLLILLIIAWGPTPATRNPLTMLFFAVLILFGVEVLRRQTAREFPELTPEAGAERRAEWWDRTRSRMASATARVRRDQPATATTVPVAPGPGGHLDELERLGRLRESNVLDEDEFQAEKRRLLGDATSAGGDETGASS